MFYIRFTDGFDVFYIRFFDGFDGFVRFNHGFDVMNKKFNHLQVPVQVFYLGKNKYMSIAHIGSL